MHMTNRRMQDAALIIFADQLDDLERMRIDNAGRLRALREDKGFEASDEVVLLAQATVDASKELEHRAELYLKRTLRSHRYGPWVKRTMGVGEKQGARLLAAIGDPAYRDEWLDDGTYVQTERSVAQLWAYCGYHVVDGAAPKRRRVKPGMTDEQKRSSRANWNHEARKRTWLVASSCMKQRDSPYRAVYDEARAQCTEAVDEGGRPLTLMHQHNRAIRRVAKQVLKDLWRESRRLHGLAYH
jgi:hypothetical protein